MNTADAVAKLSPVAATFAPVDACDICDAPVRRWDMLAHRADCLAIEHGLHELKRGILPGPGELALARRRRGQ